MSKDEALAAFFGKLPSDNGKASAAQMLALLRGWSDSDFANAATGEYCEDIKAMLEGAFSRVLDRLEALQAQPVGEEWARERAYQIAYGPLRSAQHALNIIAGTSGNVSLTRALACDESERIEQAIAALDTPAALTASPPVVEREAIDRALILAVEDFINEPPRLYDIEPMEVRDYRHSLYRIWSPLRDAILALTPVEGVGENALRNAVVDLLAIVKGDLSGPTQVSGVISEAEAALAALSTPVAQGDEVRDALRAEIINTPETADFMAGVPIEAAHQRERWGASHDAGKSPFDWFWLIGYLSQKAADAQVRGDAEKAKHHTISTAAALANWHLALSGETDMRPGIGPGNGGEKPGSAFAMADALATLTKGARDAG